MSIMKELSNAEWKVDPNSLVLGKMIGKGGFGEHWVPSFTTFQGDVQSVKAFSNQS